MGQFYDLLTGVWKCMSMRNRRRIPGEIRHKSNASAKAVLKRLRSVRAGDENFPLQDAASNQGDLILTVLAVTIELIAKYFLHLGCAV